jgi:Mg-chelatase subunit ChlD
MNPEQPHSPQEEMEIRITAMLLGELSPAEARELEAKLVDQPELQLLRRRLEHAIALMHEARALRDTSNPAPAQLSQERRERLLATFRGIQAMPSPSVPAAVPVPKVVKIGPGAHKRRWKAPLILAASIATVVSFGVWMLQEDQMLASRAPEFVYQENEYAGQIMPEHSLADAIPDSGANRWYSRYGRAENEQVPVSAKEMAGAKGKKAEVRGTMRGRASRGAQLGKSVSELDVTTAPERPSSAPAMPPAASVPLPSIAMDFSPQSTTALPKPEALAYGLNGPATAHFAERGAKDRVDYGNQVAAKDNHDEPVVAAATLVEKLNETRHLAAGVLADGSMSYQPSVPGKPQGGSVSVEQRLDQQFDSLKQLNSPEERLAASDTAEILESKPMAEGRRLNEGEKRDRADSESVALYSLVPTNQFWDLAARPIRPGTDGKGEDERFQNKEAAPVTNFGAQAPQGLAGDGVIGGTAFGASDRAMSLYKAGKFLPELSDTSALGFAGVAGGKDGKNFWAKEAVVNDVDGIALLEGKAIEPTVAPASGPQAVEAKMQGRTWSDQQGNADVAELAELAPLNASKPSVAYRQPLEETAKNAPLGSVSAAAAEGTGEKEEAAARAKEVVVSELSKATAVDAKGDAQKLGDGQEAQVGVPVSKSEPALMVKEPEPAPIPQPEVATAENAFSTFSLNVSDVSYRLTLEELSRGRMPEAARIRSEEFINAFDYRDPAPVPGEPLAFHAERARYPFAHNRDLLRLSVKTAAEGRENGRALNLVLLIDNSGSMERADRVRTLREALRVLAAQLQPQDRLSVITFSRAPRLWADGVPGNEASAALERAGQITPEGGTDLSAALNLGYKTALKHYEPTRLSRVVLLTDGAANLGEVKADVLKENVERHRKQGVAFDCFGIGWEGYNDDLLEQLARNGDGRYGFINSPEEAATEFAGKLAGALQVAASDVKVQVEFNPRRTTAYRQVGYARHQLKKEQFRDNTVDAAEIGAAEAGNALYAVEVNPRGEGEIARVRVRYKVPGTSDYREKEWTVPYEGPAPAIEQGSSSLRLAATASAFSEMLAQSPYAAEVTTDRLLQLINGIPAIYGADRRPAQLESAIRQAKSVSGR